MLTIPKATFVAFTSIILLGISACTKTEEIDILNNKLPNYKSISTLRIENYVQRMFIDLLGRESTNIERDSFTRQLKRAQLHDTCRARLIKTLLFDTTYRIGDSSYRHAFSQRIYDISKARFLEGASDPDIASSLGSLDFGILLARLEGDSIRVYLYQDYKRQFINLLNSRYQFNHKKIDYREMVARMINNSIYDGINMNSFNYVIASFDDVLTRKPSQEEFDRSYEIIEKNVPKVIFGRWASNKNEFCQALVQSDAFHEAQIRWLYYVLLRRESTTDEVSALFNPFFNNHSIENIMYSIIKTDEYAQFQ